MKNTANQSILLVEDNPVDARLIKEILLQFTAFNYQLVIAETLKEGCNLIYKKNIVLILLDINLADSSGKQTFDTINDFAVNIPIVLVSGLQDLELSLSLIQKGAQDYIVKSDLSGSLLGKTIQYAIERKRLQMVMQASKDYLENIINSVASPIFVKDENHQFCLVNDAFCSLLGLPRIKIIGTTGHEYLHEEDMKVFIAKDQEVFSTGRESINEELLTDVAGNTRTIISTKTLYTDLAGNKFLVGVINNITEQRHAEEALRDSNEILSLFLKLSPIYTFIREVTPAASRVLKASENYIEMIGIHGSEMEGKTMQELFPPDFAAKMTAEDWAVIANGKVLQVDEELNGRFYITIKYPILQRGKNFLASYSIDITEQKQAEEQLRKLSRAVEQSPASILLTDTDGKIEYANPKALKIAGYELTEIIGQNPRLFSSGETPKSVYKDLWETIMSGHEWSGEFHNKRKNGELYWELASISPIINEKGIITNYLAVKEDITDRKQSIEELLIAKEHAEESDRLKSAFLCNMSHEIRTPMNGILGFAELLQEPDLTGEEQRKYTSIMRKSGDRMLSIINDIVDISKIEAGLMKVDIKLININEIIEFIYSFFKPLAVENGIQLLYKNTLPTKEAYIKSDREKVYSILTNLVRNATKYTMEGGIEFGYELIETSHAVATRHAMSLQFYVKDTGIGIPKDRHLAIFERFIQADISDPMAQQGAGLGLSIAKAYVEMLGGKIWVDSEVGKGSTFYFTLPYNTDPEEKINDQIDRAPENVGHNAGKLKILIAEDDEISKMLLSITIREYSNEVHVARTGIEAVEICRNFPDIDLILMDIRMPDMNGYEATRQIRQFNKDVIVIAQTAFAQTGDREKSLAAGCNDYISKPINPDELLALIQKYLNK